MTARHAAPRRRRLHTFLDWLRAAPGPRRMMRATWLRDDDLTDEDKGVVLWVDGLVQTAAIPPPGPLEVARARRPLEPARRPQVLAAARVRAVAILRALPLDAVPHLRKGQGYSDSTGSFKAIAQEPPPLILHAHESITLSQGALLEGLAKQQAEEWGP